MSRNALLALIISVALLSACVSSPRYGNAPPARQSIAVLGVTAVSGVNTGKSSGTLSSEFNDLIRETGHYQTLRTTEVVKALNSVADGQYSALLSRYKATGDLQYDDVRSIQAARLPVQTVLIARFEKNAITHSQTDAQELRNNAGVIMTDRVRYQLLTKREMQLRATLIDVGSGAVVWSQTYRAEPQTESSYVYYYGSSFSGSLAAKLANTMANGIGEPEKPPEPSLQLTVRSLMREVVRNMPRL